jgi:hypothetical protein
MFHNMKTDGHEHDLDDTWQLLARANERVLRLAKHPKDAENRDEKDKTKEQSKVDPGAEIEMIQARLRLANLIKAALKGHRDKFDV